MNHADKTIATKRVLTTVTTAALWLASWLGSGVALGQSMVSSTLLKDQGVKEHPPCACSGRRRAAARSPCRQPRTRTGREQIRQLCT